MRQALLQLSKKVLFWFDTEAAPAKPSADERFELVRTLPFFAVHLTCLAVIWVGWSPFAVGFALALYLVRMFAITGFYHRYFSHRSFKAGRVSQFFFALLGCTAVQRGPLWWAAHHRFHHRHSDDEQDPHSPKQRGFWWSHMFWFTCQAHFPTDYERVKDFAKYPELRWLNRYDMFVPFVFAALIFLLGMVLERTAPGLGATGPRLLIWGFFISTVALWHGTYTVNSMAHVFGKRRFQTKDESRNNWFIALITLGEGWHNNHHRYPAGTRQGFYWWEIDITYYVLKAMAFFGIVWDLKPVPNKILQEGRRS